MQDLPNKTDPNKKVNSEPGKNPRDTLQKRFEQLQSSFDQLSSQLITTKENIQKGKRETTGLKFLLYIGFFLLLIGFIYSNTTLQRVQMRNFQSDIQALTHKTNQDLTSLKRIILDELQRVTIRLGKNSIDKQSEVILRSTIANVNRAVSQIKVVSPQTSELIKNFNRKSNALLISYASYKKELSSQFISDKKTKN